MWEFKTGNTFGATVFSSYGAFWMSYAALFIDAFGFLGYYTNSNDLENDLGIYLLSWAIFSLLVTIAAHRTTLVLTTLLFVVFLTFLMLSIGKFALVAGYEDGSWHLQRVGGCFGIIASAIAWYYAMASLLTEKSSLFRLPVGDMDPIWLSLGFVLPCPKDV